MMYFSRVRLRRDISPQRLAFLTSGDGYQVHRLVWNFFDDNPEQERDFIYRFEPGTGWPSFYTVSEREPQDDSGMWDIKSKTYQPKLQIGQQLGFTLCANPIRSRKDESGRQHRHDVIMEAKLALKKEDKPINMPVIIQENAIQWLMDRANANGFIISTGGVRADGYRQHRLFKGKGKQPITFSTVDITGILTVKDSDLFIEKCLFRGIGPAKGFGCGLMLVRKV